LQGNCRFCGTHFSPRYFFIELMTGILFLALFLQFGFGISLFAHWAFACLLVVGTFTDIDHYILPDGVTVGGMLFGFAVAAILGNSGIAAQEFRLARDLYESFASPALLRNSAAAPWFAPLAWSVASAALGWGLLAAVGFAGRILFRKEAMGGGDVKLFAFLGAYLGALNCVWILFLSAVLGSCIGMTLILLHKIMRTDEFEVISLTPDRAVKVHSRIAEAPLAATSRRDNLLVGQTAIPAAEILGTLDVPPQPLEPLLLRIARRTSRQLHHFPFGPYIAAAALIVLFFHEPINRWTRVTLLLPVDAPGAMQLEHPEAGDGVYLQNFR
jgi:prepilin signal peptidase PulO-like enzyme (type II secretory pathway)